MQKQTIYPYRINAAPSWKYDFGDTEMRTVSPCCWQECFLSAVEKSKVWTDIIRAEGAKNVGRVFQRKFRNPVPGPPGGSPGGSRTLANYTFITGFLANDRPMLHPRLKLKSPFLSRCKRIYIQELVGTQVVKIPCPGREDHPYGLQGQI